MDIKTRGYILCQIRVKVKVLQLKIMAKKVIKKTKRIKDLKSKKNPELKEFRIFY